MRARRADTSLQRACSAVLDDNGPQAVTVTADRCSSEHPQLGSGSIGTARARLSSPPDRLDATWPTSRSVISPLILRAPEPPLGAAIRRGLAAAEASHNEEFCAAMAMCAGAGGVPGGSAKGGGQVVHRGGTGPGATPGPGRGPWRPLLIRFTGTAWHGSGTVDPQVKRRARPGEVQPRLGLEQAHRVRTRPLPRPSSLPG